MTLMIVLAGLLACPRPEPPPAPVVPPPQVIVTPIPMPPAPAIDSVLGSVGWTLTLPRERQAEEIDRWTVAVARDNLPTDRLRLAMLLAMADPALRDEPRVRELLRGQWFGDGQNMSAEFLARMLLDLVEQREQAVLDTARQQKALEEERALREVLQDQLTAMQEIEKQMEARDRDLDVEEVLDGSSPGGR